MAPRHILALLWVAACQPSTANLTGFGSTPEMTLTAPGSTSEGPMGASSSGTSTGEASGPAGDSAETSAEPPRDLGVMPDFGEEAPLGCKGKIDFLFMISRSPNMIELQDQLALAVPQFIATIQAKFADFDYHIMVVTGDDGWGSATCDAVCPDLVCKVGEPCCGWYHPSVEGNPCCNAPDYPCDKLDTVTKCDRTWGAGEVFPAGVDGEANKRCPIDGELRYLVKGQSDLEGTFECIAKVGASGWWSLGQALTAAVQDPINEPGGCNRGFLRKDALLMVTFISINPDEKGVSEGTPAEWAQAVLDAKRGDDRAVVMLNIGGCDNCPPPNEDGCSPPNRLCSLVTMFPYHHQEYALVPDYGPAFVKAASLVETACAGFTPPPG